MKAVCDEKGRWWVISDLCGESVFPWSFDSEEDAWEAIDNMPEDYPEPDRDFTPPYEP